MHKMSCSKHPSSSEADFVNKSGGYPLDDIAIMVLKTTSIETSPTKWNCNQDVGQGSGEI